MTTRMYIDNEMIFKKIQSLVRMLLLPSSHKVNIIKALYGKGDKMEDIKKPEMPKLCITCNWWHLDGTTQECRRRAPTRNLQCTECCFPPTSPVTWCGEWESATATEIKRRKESLSVNKG